MNLDESVGAISPQPTINGIVRSIRPKQWIKNVLVVAGPLAAAELFELSTLVSVLIAFICFALMASAIYLINDVIDINEDRIHPVKRFRPIAAGVVSTQFALGLAAAFIVLSLGLAFLTGRLELAIVLVVYLIIQILYCVYLKHVAVLDLAIVSSGFLLRAIAGGVAAGIVLSPWFLLVASFGSLFMVAGKRYSELHLVGKEKKTRKTLEAYSLSYLRFVWGIAAASLVVFYSLWAVDIGGVGNGLFAKLSIVPFLIAILRYAVDIDRGAAGEPESVVMGDKVLLALGLIWLILFGISALLVNAGWTLEPSDICRFPELIGSRYWNL